MFSFQIQRPYPITLLGITNAETIDLIFPDWLNRAFVGSGNDTTYRPYDLNMPSSLLRLVYHNYKNTVG